MLLLKKRHQSFYVIFERISNKTIKTNFPGWGFLFPGTACIGKCIGTYPLSVSFCMKRI